MAKLPRWFYLAYQLLSLSMNVVIYRNSRKHFILLQNKHPKQLISILTKSSHFSPVTAESLEQDKVVSIVYTLVNPMLSPLIRSLRNMGDKSISFTGCAAQFFVFGGLAYTECYMLAVMAYDWYVAISSPLLYAAAKSKKLCMGLVAASYLTAFVNSTVITSCTFALSFCNTNVIDDFFCDLPPLVKLSCDVTDSYQMLLYFILTSNIILPSALILASYAAILAAVLKMRSATGQHKAFSTCAAHLTAITLYYSSILFIYSQPSSSYVLGRDKVVSVFYTVVIPMPNPFIYSLRNQEVKEALKRLVKRQTAS
ncbi:olfactory receptor 9G19-like [Larus michahellis]|uniref:olfactory receptor 9G19-like n=1 Tax=Larus michahellis TaxID=119627 RepID=UPI003D9AF95F